MNDDRRMIEDYLPIDAISKEAARENSARKGHISTLYLWRGFRPLMVCRAAHLATGEVFVKRIQVNGRKRWHPVRLTTNEWYKAQQLGET